MTAFLLHLRSSVARWALVPLTVLGVAVVFGGTRFWVGIWPETGAAAQVSASFLSIFAAGVTAWIAATVEVRGMREQAAAAALRPLTVELTRFAAALTWLLAPYLLVSAAAFTYTAVSISAPGIRSFVAYIMLGVVLMVFATAWGWLAGRLFPPLIAALCAALSWFLLASVLGDSTGAAPLSGPPWLEVPFPAVGLRLVAVLVFAVAVCGIGWRAGRPGRFERQIAGALAALLGVAVVHVATTVPDRRTPVAQPLCVQGTIEYCLWPEHAKYRSMVAEVDAQVAALPVTLPLPRRIVDYRLSGSTRWVDDIEMDIPGDFDPEFDISEESRWALARAVGRAITQKVFDGCDPAVEDPQERWEQLSAWLEWRLAGGGTPDYRTNAADDTQAAWATGRRIAAERSEQDQSVWVTNLIAEKKADYCRAG
ncbi:hypothetical protein QLQ12_07010 [Actinoplanes sp. NEAU-A12]|uniref:ABC transporter permease n=1 Tax=Actinoplanes sandaracinus TaxID=3045177 RepID=A0ABT6WF59_9ACTN|nr:hypothetical protein [Actinoplanes sandaracinus]MDI6098350.1 hypothetical protein [Actinoplanes sandaracinus]